MVNNDSIVLIVKMLLVGLIDEQQAAENLSLSLDEIKSLLSEFDIGGAAMMPCHVNDHLDITYLDIGQDAFAQPCYDDVVDVYRVSDVENAPLALSLSVEDVLCASVVSRLRGPTGLIGHVGRCGSTLLCGLLATADDWVAIKEPEAINRLLLRLADQPHERTRETVGKLVAAILHCLGHGARRGRNGQDRKCVVKLTSWNLLLASDLGHHLLNTPMVVLTRDPWATVASSLDQPPGWSMANASVPNTRDHFELARLFAMEWSQIVDAALSMKPPPLFIRYEDLIRSPTTVLNRVHRHFGQPGEYTLGTATDLVMKQYSKADQHEAFEPSGKHRRNELEPAYRDVVTAITAKSWVGLCERVGGRP